MATSAQLKQSVLEIVKSIPDGKVMYFGQIADMVGTQPRLIGYIMTGLNEEEMQLVPWYRVVAKTGYISSLKLGAKGLMQKELLLKEGYNLKDDYVDMNDHLWLFAGIAHQAERVDDYAVFIEQLKR